MHFSSLIYQLSQLESDIVSCSIPAGEKDVLRRQTRVIRLFMQDEQECRANFGTFHAFAAKVQRGWRRAWHHLSTKMLSNSSGRLC